MTPKRYKSIKCPFCRRKMQSVKNDFPITTDNKIQWKCSFCKALFQIQELPFYPVEEAGHR